MAQHGHSEACCTVPPVSVDYTGSGKYIDLDGMRIYHTGPSDATSAILVIYDIFGLDYPQTIQGADILAHVGEKDHHYQVFIPDWFLGNPVPIDWFPPDTEEKKKGLGEFFSGKGAPPKTAEKIPGVIQALTEKTGGKITKWGILGYCWGGKVAGMTSGKGTPFSAAIEAHPAMVDPNDAKNITIPIAMLASKDEDAEAVKGFKDNLKVPNHVETFSDQIHGWMAARGDLSNKRVAEEYRRGYQVALDFFHQHL